MYFFILTAVGLVLLAAFVVPSRQKARACNLFIGTWFVLCACHIAWRLLAADGAELGQGWLHELGEHVMVFGFPALLALALRKRFGAAA